MLGLQIARRWKTEMGECALVVMMFFYDDANVDSDIDSDIDSDADLNMLKGLV